MGNERQMCVFSLSGRSLRPIKRSLELPGKEIRSRRIRKSIINAQLFPYCDARRPVLDGSHGAVAAGLGDGGGGRVPGVFVAHTVPADCVTLARAPALFALHTVPRGRQLSK